MFYFEYITPFSHQATNCQVYSFYNLGTVEKLSGEGVFFLCSGHRTDFVRWWTECKSKNSLQRWQSFLFRWQEAEVLYEAGQVQKQLHAGKRLSKTHTTTCIRQFTYHGVSILSTE